MAGIVSIVSDNPDQLTPAVLAITTAILENQTDNAAGNATVSGSLRTEGYRLCSMRSSLLKYWFL